VSRDWRDMTWGEGQLQWGTEAGREAGARRWTWRLIGSPAMESGHLMAGTGAEELGWLGTIVRMLVRNPIPAG
jgi:hypothetical protein